ncbi:MAG TPA: protein kinase [Gammaproteobacteria bacterium]|nr:protein kinase [Gammaproteobacteria bacterium]
MLTETGGFQEEPNAALGALADLARRFQIRERLDHGRLGTVYRAADKHRQNGWGEPIEVALLIVPAEIVRDPRRLHAFARVFEAVQPLRHRHIAAVHDFAREGSAYFMTMELVDGESLRSVMDSLQPELISQTEALDVVRAVGQALLYAHEAGVVHGDLRAENVLVAPRRQVKVLFSAACLAGSGPFPAEKRDDVWGLAALAYELLSGTKPPTQTALTHASRPAADALPPIKGLSRRRWKVLRAALGGRDDRLRGVAGLLEGLGLTGGRPAPSRRSGSAGRLLGRTAVACVLMAGVVLAAGGVLRLGPGRITHAAVSWYGGAQDAVRQYAIAPAMGLVERLRTEGANDAAKRRTPRDAREQPGTEARAGEAEAGTREPPSDGVAAARGRGGQEKRAASQSAPPQAGARTNTQEKAAQPRPPQEKLVQPQEKAAQLQAKAAQSQTKATPPQAKSGEPQTKAVQPQANPAPSRAQRAAVPAEAQTLSFADQRIVVSEDETVAVVRILRSKSEGVLPFVLWTSDGTAAAGDDYGDIGRFVDSFHEGENSRTVFIPITNDSVPERRETFYVHMSRLSRDGRQQGPLQTAAIVIVDDDS